MQLFPRSAANDIVQIALEAPSLKMYKHGGENVGKAALNRRSDETTHGARHALKARLKSASLYSTLANTTSGDDNLVTGIHGECIILCIVKVLSVWLLCVITHRHQYLSRLLSPHIQRLELSCLSSA